MKNHNELKSEVRERYSAIANQSKNQNQSSCCGSGSCGDVYSIMADEYRDVNGYNPEADLGLGCGLPVEFAKINPGDVVVDLGSGAGNDCFVARAAAGESGKIIGVDMTPPMIDKARAHAARAGFTNMEFRLGEIENLPVNDNTADVVISNCVLNLVPDKEKAFAEVFRILKPGGHFSISDVVIEGMLPAELLHAAEMYAGCIAGALQKEEYLSVIRKAGFENVVIQKQKQIHVPENILREYLTPDQTDAFIKSNTGIYSITVFAEKKKTACCNPGCCN